MKARYTGTCGADSPESNESREVVLGMRSVSTPRRMSSNARRASESRPMQLLARAGLVARGVIYILIGWVAILVALGSKGHQADQQGALQLLAGTPVGLVSLWLLFIGFVGYALWRFSQVLSGVPGEGTGAGPRLKSLVRGLVYASFAVLTFKIITGKHDQPEGPAAGRHRLADAPHRRSVAGRHRRPDHRDRRRGAGYRGRPAEVHEAPDDLADERRGPGRPCGGSA